MKSVLWQVREFDEIDSTNTYVANLAREGAAEGLVARADFQTAGRGRLDRSWEAPRGVSLLTSILLRPSLPANRRHLVASAVALSARTALVRLSGLQPGLKWPNDLVVNDRKLGGLLAEVIGDGEAFVVGIGITLQWPGPEGVGGTCVKDEIGVTITPQAMLDLLLSELDKRRTLLDTPEGLEELQRELLGALDTIGRHVRVERANDTLHGVATTVNDDGLLLLETDEGLVEVVFGDIVHLRATEPS